MGFELTEEQQKAVSKMKKWFNSKTKQIFVIAGYAGTGKSTIVKSMIEELKLNPWEVKYATFTGKAALVLTKKGSPAITIHRLIYKPVEIIKKDEKTGKETRKIEFIKVPFLDPELKVIVIDEVSMVSKIILDDLKSFGVPIIALGDPGQLPPIGDDNGLLSEPDVFLTQIHRQAESNPIIYLSMLVREGKKLPYGMHGKKVAVLKERETDSYQILKIMTSADQILCGKNDTRRNINSTMRSYYGYEDELPEKGDKLICTKNDWSTELCGVPLINGLIGYCHNQISKETIDNNRRLFTMDFRPEFIEDDYFEGLLCDLEKFQMFEEPIQPWIRGDIKFADFDFGYAITVHKAQGSSWEKVCLFNEILSRDADSHKKWLYTGITRSSDKLILLM
jgi:exodeoxyribonuclease-5